MQSGINAPEVFTEQKESQCIRRPVRKLGAQFLHAMDVTLTGYFSFLSFSKFPFENNCNWFFAVIPLNG